MTGNRAKFAAGAKIIHIDVDGSELSKNVNAVCGLRGDLKLTLQKLLPLISESKKESWNSEVRSFAEKEQEYLDNREELTPRRAVLTLNKSFGRNTAVGDRRRSAQMWAAQNLNFRKTRRLFQAADWVRWASDWERLSERPSARRNASVLITGDGSFGMCLNELATAVTYNVPVVILILNNGVLGMVRQWQTLFFDKHYSNTVLNRKTDFVALARAFGADGEAVSDADELDSALTRAFNYNGPYVIDCAIDKDEFVLPMLPPGGSMDDIIVKVGD